MTISISATSGCSFVSAKNSTTVSGMFGRRGLAELVELLRHGRDHGRPEREQLRHQQQRREHERAADRAALVRAHRVLGDDGDRRRGPDGDGGGGRGSGSARSHDLVAYSETTAVILIPGAWIAQTNS